MVKFPSSAYWWLPWTVKVPPAKLIVPAEVGPPSPQSMVAVYSPGVGLPAVSSGPPGSVNVATVCAGESTPSTAPKVKPPVATTDGSATWAARVTAVSTSGPTSLWWWTVVVTVKPAAGDSSA